MMRILTIILLILCETGAASGAAASSGVPASQRSEEAVLSGQIRSDGRPVPFANVGIVGTALGAAADKEGIYRIEGLAAGTYTVVASAVGYRTAERQISIESGSHVRLDFELEEAVIESDGIVVTGTLLETYVKDSPVKVDVVSSRHLEKVPTSNVMDAINRIGGLREQIDCGVCGTNNIRINGMDGPYAVVLIDGMPIMSSLATVYGLNGISPAMIKQIEVIKGPMSTLYGSEALAGVINVITKSPRTAPTFSVNALGSNQGEYSLDFGVVPSRSGVSSLISGTAAYNQHYVDENGDGFADLTLNKRGSLFGKVTTHDGDGRERLSLSGRAYFEDRIGGTRQFVDLYSAALRGSDRHYGEAIRTGRGELLGSLHIDPERTLRFDFAANEHRQDSYYGVDHYEARQRTAFGQLLWHSEVAGTHTLLTGVGMRLQHYDDNTGSTGEYDESGRLVRNRPDTRVIPGAFAQHETRVSDGLRLLTGIRVDHQADHGFITSPRISLKAELPARTTLRLNGGTGFRVVNLFTEDHAAYTGARATVVLEDLRPERSYSGTVSLQHIVPLGGSPLTIELDGFYTVFTNKIEPDYSVPGEIRYANLDGSATTRGVSLNVSQDVWNGSVAAAGGVTLMDVFRRENGEKRPIEFAPDLLGNGTLTFAPADEWSVDYTVTVTGRMKLPEYGPEHPRPAWSPPHSIHNLQITREIHLPQTGELQIYGAAKNVLDYVQPSPLIDPDNPFGDAFDTTYVYGPIRGRNFGFGVRLILL